MEQYQQIIAQVYENALQWGMDVLAAVLILIIGFWLARLTRKMIIRAFEKVESVDVTLVNFLASLARWGIITLTVLTVMDQFGVETTSLVAIVGAAGLAIGLALQGTLSNIASGVMLLLFRPFNVGDYVNAAGMKGTVTTINMFTTDLVDDDGNRVILPNSKVWGAPIVTYKEAPVKEEKA